MKQVWDTLNWVSQRLRPPSSGNLKFNKGLYPEVI